MTEQNKKTYTPEFKKEAVRLVTEQGYKVTEAARNLGIHPSVFDPLERAVVLRRDQRLPGQGAFNP